MINIVGKTFYALFILLLVAVAGLFLSTMLPIPGAVEVKIVKSGSMEPAIPTGSLVFVRPSESYAVGDVITFGRDTAAEIPTTHRIIGVDGAGSTIQYQTMGDANEDPDPRAIAPGEVIGKVFLSVPYAGYILDFARTPWGFALMIGIPAGLIIVDEVLRIVVEVQKMRRKDDDVDEIERAFREGPDVHHTPTHRPPTPHYSTRHFDIPKS